MKNILVILFILCSVVAYANPARVIVKGCNNKVYIYNGDRGENRRSFTSGEAGNTQEIEIPEEQCRDLLYLIADGLTSWIRVLPGETVEMTLREQQFEFTGDEENINDYLYEWTRKFYFEKQNALIYQVQVMMSVIPMSKKGLPDAKEFYTPGYMHWVAGLRDQMQKDLKKAKLKDKDFVKEQQRRIDYSWWELQFANYQVAKNIGDVPAEAMKFISGVKLDNIDIQQYPGYYLILKGYMNMADQCGMFKYSAAEYLRSRAELIKNTELQENYILDELFLIFKMNGYLYQGDQLLSSVEPLIVTERGKEKFQECKEMYTQLITNDMVGKPAIDFVFESYKGDSLRLQQFRGKYLFIDIWATWCTPCRAQIPFLKKLEKALEGKPIQFLSISVDKQENKERWKSLVKQYDLEHANCAITPDTFNHPMFEKYKVKAIPRFILIDPEGKVVMSCTRFPSDPLLKMQLEELMQ